MPRLPQFWRSARVRWLCWRTAYFFMAAIAS
jgi:hypothetical protein